MPFQTYYNLSSIFITASEVSKFIESLNPKKDTRLNKIPWFSLKIYTRNYFRFYRNHFIVAWRRNHSEICRRRYTYDRFSRISPQWHQQAFCGYNQREVFFPGYDPPCYAYCIETSSYLIGLYYVPIEELLGSNLCGTDSQNNIFPITTTLYLAQSKVIHFLTYPQKLRVFLFNYLPRVVPCPCTGWDPL